MRTRVLALLSVLGVCLAFVAGAQASPTTLLGSTAVGPTADYNPAGEAEAFPFTATATGEAVLAHVYVDSGNTATDLKVGLYSDDNGSASALLATGDLPSPNSSAWNTVSISGDQIVAGTQYWIALLGTGGTLTFRDTDSQGIDS